MSRLARGAEVDGWRILDVLPGGGTARLYRVARAGQTALMKLPRLDFGTPAACYTAYENEATLLSRLAGPHAPRLLDQGGDDDAPYLVVEEIPGTSLADAAARAPLAAEEIARLGAPVASALHALHAQNVVHLDLKPAHVRYRPTGEAVLIDLGLARHAQLPDLMGEEAQGPLGTPAYMAPEQVLGLRGDPRSDVWAFGAILYQLATGTLPHGAPTSRSGLRRRLWLDPVPPRAQVASLPEWLQEIVLRCLAIDPAARYATAAQLAYDLRHPEQIVVGLRGRRTQGDDVLSRARRWLGTWLPHPAARVLAPAAQLASAPHLLAAVDTQADAPLQAALLNVVRALARPSEECLVTCLTVVDPASGGPQDESDETLQQGMLTARRVALRHWAAALGLPASRLRIQVILGDDPAGRIIAYAALHHVDHIVLGARGSGPLRRILGSVSSRTAAQASCSVTVVRASDDSINRLDGTSSHADGECRCTSTISTDGVSQGAPTVDYRRT